MTDSKKDFLSIRIEPGVKQRFDDEQDRIRRIRGKKPTQTEVLEMALDSLSGRQSGGVGDLVASIDPETRVRVTALIEMLTGRPTGIQHLDSLKPTVIACLDTWVSHTQQQASGRKRSGRTA